MQASLVSHARCWTTSHPYSITGAGFARRHHDLFNVEHYKFAHFSPFGI